MAAIVNLDLDVLRTFVTGPIFGRFFANGEGGSCVSAHRSRLLGTFGAPVSGRKNPVPGGSPGDGGTEQRHRAEPRKNGV
jgi:hypothetical protein